MARVEGPEAPPSISELDDRHRSREHFKAIDGVERNAGDVGDDRPNPTTRHSSGVRPEGCCGQPSENQDRHVTRRAIGLLRSPPRVHPCDRPSVRLHRVDVHHAFGESRELVIRLALLVERFLEQIGVLVEP